MRSISTFLILFFATVVNAQQLTAYFDYKVFNSPGQSPYIETYMHFDGTSLTFAENKNGKLQAQVVVTLIFQEDSEIANFQKIVLSSPETDEGGHPDFMDQRRFSLASGTYSLEIKMQDLNLEGGTPVEFKQAVHVDRFNEENMLSDIQLLESARKADEESAITKAGYDLVPFVSTYYPSDASNLLLYAEVYGPQPVTEENKGYLANIYIEKKETGDVLSMYRKAKRIKNEPVVPIIHKFDISMLRTGNYNVVMEIRNTKNELVCKRRQFFQRANNIAAYDQATLDQMEINGTFVGEYTNEDTINEYVASLRPIANDVERRIILKDMKNYDLQTKQRMLYSFWYSRNESDPKGAFEKYREQVHKANKEFSMFKRKGYDTDRGRVFLKYGPPSSVVDRPNEPHSYPYQIWHYYRAGDLNNRRFVFIDRDLVYSSYELLHSDMPGELFDRTWQSKLQQRNQQRGNVDVNNPAENSWGTKADEFYTNPY